MSLPVWVVVNAKALPSWNTNTDILDIETDLTEANPTMWWEQIQEYIFITYIVDFEKVFAPHRRQNRKNQKNTRSNIKGSLFGVKANHKIVRGQWGKEMKDITVAHLIKPTKLSFPPETSSRAERSFSTSSNKSAKP